MSRRRRQLPYRRRPFRRVSRRGVALVAAFEGFRSRPYRDAVGVWTIGYGHTRGVGPNTPPIGRRRAFRLLRRELDEYADAVRAVNRARRRTGALPLTQPQGDALTSFVYNVGTGALGDTGVGRAVRAGRDRRATRELSRWVYAGGRRLLGLVRRRRAEAALYRLGTRRRVRR